MTADAFAVAGRNADEPAMPDVYAQRAFGF